MCACCFNSIFLAVLSAIGLGLASAFSLMASLPGRVAQSEARLTQEPEVPGSIPGPATYFRFFFASHEGQLSVTGESMCTEYWLTA